MTDPGSIRVLLVEEDSDSATVTRDLLDVASSGLVELIHVERLDRAVERLTADAFDVILFRALARISHKE